jgi:hypothetical protein
MRRVKIPAFGLALCAALSVTGASAQASVTIESFTAEAADTTAGAHADATTAFTFATRQNAADGFFYPVGGLPENIVLRLPVGLIGNPNATPKCPRSQQDDFNARECPADTQVGAGTVVAGGFGPLAAQIYNMVPGPNEPARLAIQPDAGTAPSILTFTADPARNYALTAAVDDVSTSAPLLASNLTLWAVPADHNGAAALGAPRVPFMENPTGCATTPTTTLEVNTYAAPTTAVGATATSPRPTRCASVPFNPSLAVTPDNSQAGAPAGLSVQLELPQNDDPEGQSTAELEKAVVTLPEGMTISPSAASQRLEGCTDEQFAAHSGAPAQCPSGSAIGEDEVQSPVLPQTATGGEGELSGKIYLGQPLSTDPTSGRMFRVFQELKGFGLDIKLQGSVVANPETGQLTATFANLPELPFLKFKLNFRGGPNAVLVNPPSCGSHTVTSELYPYSGNPAATPSATFNTSYSGGTCPSSLPLSVSSAVSSASSQAGALTPLSVTFSRNDETQPLGQIDATLPHGLLGYVSKVPLCEAAAAAAGTCAPESRIGTVSTSAGAGPDPLTVQGSVYLAHGSNGYPFMLSVVVPAIAGPYDLGDVVVPVWLQVNSDGSITAVSGPLPSILDGTPLDIRSVTMSIDRPEFTVNPTNCGPLSLTGFATALSGATTALSAPFSVSGCGILSFTPSFTAATQGSTSKANGASLTVRVTQPPGQANIKSVHVELPEALPSRLTTLQKACTEAQFAANPAGCPAGSFVGTATAYTPLLPVPVSGPAIFVSHGGAAFPDLDIILQGDGVTVDLVGNTEIKDGITSSTFASVPDVPISGFELNLPEGPYSQLGANGNLCEQELLMPTVIIGQNGATVKQTRRIAVTGCAPVKVTVKKAKVKSGKKLVLTVQASAAGHVTISGGGVRTTHSRLSAGMHQLTVALSVKGRIASRHRKQIRLKVGLQTARQTAAMTTSVEL